MWSNIKISSKVSVITAMDMEMLFGTNIIGEDVLNLIIENENFNGFDYIYYINRLINRSQNNEIIKYHKDIFLNNYKKLLESDVSIDKEKLLSEENCLFSNLSGMKLIERILKYCNFKHNDIYIHEKDEGMLANILLWSVISMSYIDSNPINSKSNTLLNALISITFYNNLNFSNDISNSNILRIIYLYENYLKDDKDISITYNFKKHYGYDLEVYILFLNLFCIKENTKLTETGIESIIDLKKCVTEHLFDYTKKELKDSLNPNSGILSQILIDKPIIYTGKYYFMINSLYIRENVFDIFIKKIKSCTSKCFKRKFGIIFEEYCRNIAKTCCERSKFKYYNFIDEFEYDVGNNKKASSDFYIAYNNILIVFEIKSTSRFNETTINDITDKTEEMYDNEIKKKIIKPVEQIDARMSEIKNLNPELYNNIPLNDIQSAKSIYYIIVADDIFINNYKFEADYLTNVKPIFSKNRPIYLNISEYEYLMMSLKNRKHPIDILLKYYATSYSSCNFTDLIRKEQKTFKFKRLDIFDTNKIKEYAEKYKNNI